MTEVELWNLCLWHWLSTPSPTLKGGNYYGTTDPNGKHTLEKLQISSRAHSKSLGPHICTVFLPQREALFVPLAVLQPQSLLLGIGSD